MRSTVSGAGVAVALCSIGTALGAVKRLLLPSILSRGSISSINRLWLVLRHILHWSSGRARWRIMNAIRRHCNIWLLIGERRRKLALLRAHAASSVRRIGDWSVWIGSWRRNRIILSSPSCFFFLSFPLGFLLLLPSLPFLANLLEFVWSTFSAMSLHGHVCIEMVECSVRLFATIPATFVHALNFFVAATRALGLRCSRNGNKRVNL